MSAKRFFASMEPDIPEDRYMHSGWHGGGKYTSTRQMAGIELKPFKPCVVELEPPDQAGEPKVLEVSSARGTGRVVMASRKVHEVRLNRRA